MDEQHGRDYWPAGSPFVVFLKELARINPRLNSLSIGHNNFHLPEMDDGVDEFHTEGSDHLVVSCIPTTTHSRSKMGSVWVQLLRNVRSLRFPVDSEVEPKLLPIVASRTIDLLALGPSLEQLGLVTQRSPPYE